MKKLILFLFFAFPLFAQTPVALSPVARQQFLSPTGVPLAGGCVFTYAAGTSTPLASYSESTGTFPNSNPVVLDAGGFASIYLINQAYRIVVYSSGGLNCASGSQQWTADNVSAYTILNQAQNLFLAPVTVDPPGSAGELGYRSDIPCFRGFTTLWDCFTMNEATQTLANKDINVDTNTVETTSNIAGQYLRNNGTKFVSQVIQAGDVPGAYINNLTNCAPGTVLNEIVIIAATNCVVSPSGPGLTSQFIGICISGCGSTGTPVITELGLAPCVFDNAVTPGDIVIPSVTTAGNCHDSGSMTISIVGQSLGRVWSSTAVSAGVYSILVFPPEINGANFPKVVFNTPSASSNANIGSTAMATAPSTGATYRFSFYADITGTGASCSAASTVVVAINFTDPNAAGPAGFSISVPNSGNTVATVNALGGGGFDGGVGLPIPSNNAGTSSMVFRAKGSSTIQYNSTFTAGSACSPAATYQVYPILEQLSAN